MDGNNTNVGAVSGSMTLTDNATGKSIELPVMEGSIGPKVIDVRKLYAQTGYFTYDPGFMATAACRSSITYIDGDEGVLLYRGYPIEELAAKSDFMEISYLLLFGELPTAKQKEQFVYDITHHTMVHEQISSFFHGFRRDAHPMAIMCGVVGALSAFYHDSTDIHDPYQRMVASYRLVAKMPTIAAMAFKYSMGQPFMYPQNSLGYAENFLHMCFAVPCEEMKVSPTLARAMDRIFILHADHEQNASTATVRNAGSSGANPFACIAAGIASLWGPAHGGANEAVLKMLAKIGDKSKIPEFIAHVKNKNEHEIQFGFGHRVYKNYDPRARVLRDSCHEVLDELGIKDEPLLDLAMELEKISLNDDYFISRKLYPNVDFYSGIILKAMGFPTSMFTALFAIARTVGWVAQWTEMIEDPDMKIGRPRQLFTGSGLRHYVPMTQRHWTRRSLPDLGMIPGELFPAAGEIELNAGRTTVTLTVANTGDRPIQVGSHYHFYETNAALQFDREQARGHRLDIPAGTATRFEPGQTREVRLVAYAGARRVVGFNGRVNGALD